MSNKKVAIIQSNYIPWKGYFNIIDKVDEFILYDEVQFTKRDWRNRNQIKTAKGMQWLTVPVKVKGKYFQPINETEISEKNFAKKHWGTISHAYAKAPFFKEYKDTFADIYNSLDEDLLSLMNHKFILAINEILGIDTKVSWSTDYEALDTVLKEESANNRLIDLCKKSGADIYLSGPAAQSYMDIGQFNNEGIEVEWMDYSHYRPYEQLHGEFTHYPTVLDLIFNTGKEAISYIRA